MGKHDTNTHTHTHTPTTSMCALVYVLTLTHLVTTAYMCIRAYSVGTSAVPAGANVIQKYLSEEGLKSTDGWPCSGDDKQVETEKGYVIEGMLPHSFCHDNTIVWLYNVQYNK